MCSVNLGPIVLFSEILLATGCELQLKNTSYIHIICSMYKLLTSSKDGDDLSTAFDKNRKRRVSELMDKTQRRNFHVRIFLEDNFRVAEIQENATYGVRCKMFLKRIDDGQVLHWVGGAI